MLGLTEVYGSSLLVLRGGVKCSEMAALLNSFSFAFTNSFLPKYSLKYYDYIIVKWCSGI